ncbi:Probable low-affinity inorganic phosphate transporter [Mycobacteroides abscessus subsp. abscessus]|nr:Probable low-affinity inorganic phosphate transporter [Mycobacteroides abscessus subsp. abscessus]
MATSIATGALKPKTAVLLAGILNLVGAFLSVEVAVTVTTSVIKVQDSKTGHLLPNITPSMGLTIIFAGLRSRPRPWSRCPTEPTTRRRPWVSSPLRSSPPAT